MITSTDLLRDRLQDWLGEQVVVDCVSPYVVIGTLAQATPSHLELEDVDMHDFRDTDTNRELYLVKTVRYGVQRNRKTLVLRMDEVVGISRIRDVITE